MKSRPQNALVKEADSNRTLLQKKHEYLQKTWALSDLSIQADKGVAEQTHLNICKRGPDFFFGDFFSQKKIKKCL